MKNRINTGFVLRSVWVRIMYQNPYEYGFFTHTKIEIIVSANYDYSTSCVPNRINFFDHILNKTGIATHFDWSGGLLRRNKDYLRICVDRSKITIKVDFW